MSDNKRQRWIDAIAEHAAYHRHEHDAMAGMPTHAIADCPDLAPLLAEADAAEQRADRLAAALRANICTGGHPDGEHCPYRSCREARAALADSPKEENDGDSR